MKISARLQITREAEAPIVLQITDQLTWLIASGVVIEGEVLPPIRELADELGVHMHTVREAYHRLEAAGLVSVRTRIGTTVLPFDAAAFAGAHADRRSFLIGVLIPMPVAIYQQFIQGIQEAAAAYGWMPIFAYTQDNPYLSERYSHQLIAKNVDGLIVTSPGEIARFTQIMQADQLPPIVYADAPQITRNSVSPDTEGAAYRATRHLIEHGHSRIGFVTAPLDWENVTPGYSGYRRAIEEAGLETASELVAEMPDFEPRSGYDGLAKLMAGEEPPQAIFFGADALALGALEALQDHDLRVPEDIAIASFGDLESAAISNPALTTARIPVYEIGYEAVERLQAIMSGSVESHPPLFLDCPLITRRSCGCDPTIQHQKE